MIGWYKTSKGVAKVDKHSNDQRKITIKINGEEKDFHEEIKVYHWNDAKKETAAAKENASQFEYKNSPSITSLKAKKPNKKAGPRPLKRYSNIPRSILIASVMAVFIGALIGLLFLKAMEKDETLPPEENKNPVKGNVDSETKTESLILEDTVIYFLQEGVYQNEESVKEHVENLHISGLPAAYIKGDSHIHVMVAMVPNLESGKKMRESAIFPETWPKEFSLKGKVIQNLTKEERSFLESAIPIYNKLVEEGTRAFLEGDKYVINPNLQETLNQLQKQEALEKETIKTMHASLLEAAESLQTYIQSRKQEDWLRSQQKFIDFITQYISL